MTEDRANHVCDIFLNKWEQTFEVCTHGQKPEKGVKLSTRSFREVTKTRLFTKLRPVKVQKVRQQRRQWARLRPMILLCPELDISKYIYTT